ncbi:MAG: polysaccharide biosynthesis/export family protein [Pseudomonadota bacterium]
MRGFRRWMGMAFGAGRAVSLGALLSVATVGMAAAEYRLQPGDTVRMAVAGLPLSDVDATVDIDGFVSLAWFGRVNAQGRSISELLEQVRANSDGQVIKRYTNDGELNLINPSPQDIYIELVAYRPVIVGGDVRQPGERPYVPGLTVRGAVAMAGGSEDVLLDAEGQDTFTLTRWQNDYAAAALDHATASLRTWRYTMEIEKDFDIPPPGPEQFRVSATVYDSLLAEQRQLADINRTYNSGEQSFRGDALEQARERVQILIRQQAKQNEAMEADEADMERMTQLMSSGLTNAQRVADARRASVITASRLLELEETLAEAELEVTRMTREVTDFDELRTAELLELRDLARAEALLSEVRMDNFSRALAGSNQLVGDSDILMEVETVVEIYRRAETGVERVVADMDDPVFPGDTIEVTLNTVEMPGALTE